MIIVVVLSEQLVSQEKRRETIFWPSLKGEHTVLFL